MITASSLRAQNAMRWFLKPDRELRGKHVTQIAQTVVIALEAVLNFQLRVRGESINGRDISAP